MIAYGCQNFVVVFDPKTVQVRNFRACYFRLDNNMQKVFLVHLIILKMTLHIIYESLFIFWL